MSLVIKTTVSGIKITDLNRVSIDYKNFVMKNQWYKITIPGTRYSVSDILVHGESIRHGLNSGVITEKGYEVWIHGDLAQYFSRISSCIAQQDLLKFQDLEKKYLLCESWNEPLMQGFIPNSVRNFFANGDGPYWYHKDDHANLPFEEYHGPTVDTNLNLNDDLQFADTKFYGQGKCKSLKPNPNLPTIPVDDIKNEKLRMTLKQFGFSEMLQIQYVELMPNSWLPVHMDDWTYDSGRHLMTGPVQLYFVLSGNKKGIKFKFKNVGLIDVEKPIFINNQNFVHSLVYTGEQKRGVLLAYGVRNT